MGTYFLFKIIRLLYYFLKIKITYYQNMLCNTVQNALIFILFRLDKLFYDKLKNLVFFLTYISPILIENKQF